MRTAILFLFGVFLAGCARKQTTSEFTPLAEQFVYDTLALSPVSATQTGYHKHKGIPLDELLDDYSPAGIEAQRRTYASFRDRFAAIAPGSLSDEDRVDHEMITNQIGMALLEIETLQSYRHNPTLYIEMIGTALFSCYSLKYAPEPERWGHIIARLGKIPILLDQAKRNLADSPRVWTRVAEEENNGNIDLIDKTIRAAIPADLKTRYDQAAKPAIESLRSFNDFLKKDLAKRESDWRLGTEKYGRKFRHALATERSPTDVLAEAESQLRSIREEMAKLAAPESVEAALEKIARRHSTPETYFEDAKRDLAEATEFVRKKNLLALPQRSNLEVIETPGFMRGIYAVGGFNSAPALEPHLGAFYWLTPIPKTWPKERIESKLREYNFYGLKILTLHEAMPGHYVQLEYANDVTPPARRLVRSVLGNMPYIEGWAVYATEMMIDEGYHEGKEMRLTFFKQMLRAIANTILDIKLHTQGMTSQQALDLMIKDTYQEKEEATAKLQRAELSSCQLPTYFVGWRGWLAARDEYRKARGGAFRLNEFHERALKEGSVPLSALGRLLR